MAVIHIDVTVESHPTREAFAEVASNQVTARVGIHTRVTLTLVGIYEAGLASPLGGAVALEAVDQVLTGATVIAGVGTAVIHIDRAGWPSPARRTLAFKALAGLHTTSSIKTGLRQTRVLRSLTVDS